MWGICEGAVLAAPTAQEPASEGRGQVASSEPRNEETDEFDDIFLVLSQQLGKYHIRSKNS